MAGKSEDLARCHKIAGDSNDGDDDDDDEDENDDDDDDDDDEKADDYACRSLYRLQREFDIL